VIRSPDDDAVVYWLKGHVSAWTETDLIAQVLGNDNLPFCSHFLRHTATV
jgi:hypothetical protein